MALTQDLLEPIAGDNPAGIDLRYAPAYSNIKEAREQDPPDIFARANASGGEPKKADFRKVIKLATEALRTTSKDLQLAVWLTEALIYEESFAGLADGLQLVHGLIDRFWDHLYPELEDGDAEWRAEKVDWLGNRYDPAKGSSPAYALRLVPLTKFGHTWFQYKTSQSDSTSDFEKSFADTRKAFYRTLDDGVIASRAALQALDELCSEKFGRNAPSFAALRTALEEVGISVRALLDRKLKLEPDPIEAPPPDKQEERREAETEPEKEQDSEPAPDNRKFTGELKNAADAVAYITAASQFLRRSNPSNPVSYLLLRALRWGELRGANDGQVAQLLEAPSADVRITLRKYAVAENWAKVLETAEHAMSTGCGRGWLDLQRYAITACEKLGYEAAAKALRSELKTILADMPDLPAATLSDDTGSANPETAAWLKREGFTA